MLLTTLVISSCSSGSKNYESEKFSPDEKIEVSTVLPEADTKTPKYSIKDFLPSNKNTEYTFSRGSENEIVKEYVEFLEEDKIQIKSVSGTRIASSIYKVQEDAIILTYIAEDNYIKKELFSEESNSHEILLMNPIAIGTTWNNADKTLSITSIDIPIETKFGTYNSIEVTTKGKEFTQKDYYVLNLGKIKTVVEINDTTFTTELIDYKKDELLQGTYRYYYTSASSKELFFKEEKVSELRDDELQDKIARNMYNPPREDLKPLDSNIKINFINLSPKKDYVHIDFSFNLNDKLNVGDSFNKPFLQSLANTLGFNYGVENILISFDGKSHSSEQLVLEDSEHIKVDYSNYKLLQ